MKRSIVLMVCLGMLAACGTTTKMPQNQVSLAEDARRLSLTNIPPSDRLRVVQAAVNALPQGQRYAIVAAGTAVSRKERTDVASALGAGGIAPERIAWAGGGGGELEILFRTLYATQPTPQKAMGEPYWYSAQAVSAEYGSSTEWNQAAQMVNIKNLRVPEHLDPANPLAVVGAVERYQKGEVRGLPEQSLDAGKAGN